MYIKLGDLYIKIKNNNNNHYDIIIIKRCPKKLNLLRDRLKTDDSIIRLIMEKNCFNRINRKLRKRIVKLKNLEKMKQLMQRYE